jgi:hypothetical protein
MAGGISQRRSFSVSPFSYLTTSSLLGNILIPFFRSCLIPSFPPPTPPNHYTNLSGLRPFLHRKNERETPMEKILDFFQMSFFVSFFSKGEGGNRSIIISFFSMGVPGFPFFSFFPIYPLYLRRLIAGLAPNGSLGSHFLGGNYIKHICVHWDCPFCIPS